MDNLEPASGRPYPELEVKALKIGKLDILEQAPGCQIKKKWYPWNLYWYEVRHKKIRCLNECARVKRDYIYLKSWSIVYLLRFTVASPSCMWRLIVYLLRFTVTSPSYMWRSIVYLLRFTVASPSCMWRSTQSGYMSIYGKVCL